MAQKTREFKIMQWNCRSIRQKRGDLLNISHEYDVLFLSETWLEPDSPFHLYNFNIIRSDYESGRGSGIAIAIKSNIPFRNVNTIHKKIPALDTLAIIINTPSGELLIINI